MKLFHILTGMVVLIIFAATGQYMTFGLDLPNQVFDAQRMMYRASHMYLLFVGALNVAVGCYWHQFSHGLARVLQYAASFCLLLAQPVLVYAFLVEPEVIDPERLMTLLGCILVLAGVGLNLTAASINHIYSNKSA